MRLRLSKEEFKNRRQRFYAQIREKGLEGACLFGPTEVFYLTGFAFMPTERPIAVAMTLEDRVILFVPRLEHEHAQHGAEVTEVRSYPEYPGECHPMEQFKEILAELGLADKPIGADSDGYGSGQGYRGPRLSALVSGKVTVVKDVVEDMRMIKSAEEIDLIQESARWGNLAHTLLQEYSKPGYTENEISMRASLEATLVMIKTLGKEYQPGASGGATASAGFRGQIGKNSALPHAITINAVLKPGDVLVTGAGSRVFGYGSELERTMFVGAPSAEQEKYFTLMVEVQDIAFDAIRPGRKCSEVDVAVRTFYEKHKLWDTWRHHVGHALGLLGHEAPFFDVGDDTMIAPGMVFSVEPGLYINDFGGFRHSDTLVVTETGISMITYYPRDLESMICR